VGGGAGVERGRQLNVCAVVCVVYLWCVGKTSQHVFVCVCVCGLWCVWEKETDSGTVVCECVCECVCGVSMVCVCGVWCVCGVCDRKRQIA
jgi:hypothetical protein